jgi:hypothetical protein
MTKLLLSLHVLAAILAVGPVTVAASMFPPAARRAGAVPSRKAAVPAAPGGPNAPGEPAAPSPADEPGTLRAPGVPGVPDGADPGTVRLLHRICRVYAGVGLAVPLFGFATASAMGVLGTGWLIASISLTALAAGVLIAFVLPGQEELVAEVGADRPVERAATVRLAMFTGLFNLLWATVTVLMIVRPGSTTGA